MDLGTVKKNLNNNLYETVEDCLKDIDLIWTNCKTYNKDNTVKNILSLVLPKTSRQNGQNHKENDKELSRLCINRKYFNSIS